MGRTESVPEPTNHAYRSLLEAELEIAGVPVGVVDGHHHVVPFWFHHLAGRRAHLLHIDAHSDMAGATSKSQNGFSMQPETEEEIVAYTKNLLSIASFICGADYLGLLKSIYHYDPRKEGIAVYREDVPLVFGFGRSNPRLEAELEGIYHDEEAKMRIVWNHGPRRQDVSLLWRIFRLNKDVKTPLIVDIDLDAIHCIRTPYEEFLPDRYELHLGRVADVLSRLARLPALVTIARSQNPGDPYVDPQRVDQIQQDVLHILEHTFKEREHYQHHTHHHGHAHSN